MPLALVPILAALAPPQCWSCHAVAPSHEPLCRGCRARLRFLGSDAVQIAGLPSWAAVAYEGPARDLVRGLKYRGAAGLAEALATQMAANAPLELLAARDPQADAMAAPREPPAPGPRAVGAHHRSPLALVPVPAGRARVRRRGFDQAALLAAALGRRMGIPIVACLERRGGGAPQVGRGRAARQAALAGTIRVSSSSPPAAAALVDDVVTTGATVAACAAALRAAGCERVTVLAYARTLGR